MDNGHSNIIFYKLPTAKVPWDALNGYRQISRSVLQRLGSFLKMTYLDPFASDVRTLQSTAAETLPIILILVILPFSLRRLREQADGEARLKRRVQRILNGERKNVMHRDVCE